MAWDAAHINTNVLFSSFMRSRMRTWSLDRAQVAHTQRAKHPVLSINDTQGGNKIDNIPACWQ